MSKIIVAYTMAGLSLFGALFAALALSGVARPGPTVEQIAEAKVAAEQREPPPPLFTPPTLDANRVYRMSHETPMYPAPAQSEADRQLIPAGGYFRFVQTLDTPPGPWYEISVTDGVRDSTMYLYAMDLRWKTLTPQYSPDEAAKIENERTMERVREIGAALALRRQPAVEDIPEPEPEPQTFDEWWAESSRRLGGPTIANIVASAGAAGLATILILGSIAMLTILRREHAWSRPAMHDDAGAGTDEDDPYAYASPAHDTATDEDHDEPKLEDRFRI